MCIYLAASGGAKEAQADERADHIHSILRSSRHQQVTDLATRTAIVRAACEHYLRRGLWEHYLPKEPKSAEQASYSAVENNGGASEWIFNHYLSAVAERPVVDLHIWESSAGIVGPEVFNPDYPIYGARLEGRAWSSVHNGEDLFQIAYMPSRVHSTYWTFTIEGARYETTGYRDRVVRVPSWGLKIRPRHRGWGNLTYTITAGEPLPNGEDLTRDNAPPELTDVLDRIIVAGLLPEDVNLSKLEESRLIFVRHVEGDRWERKQ